MSLKQRKIKFESRIKLNHNIDMKIIFKCLTLYLSWCCAHSWDTRLTTQRKICSYAHTSLIPVYFFVGNGKCHTILGWWVHYLNELLLLNPQFLGFRCGLRQAVIKHCIVSDWTNQKDCRVRCSTNIHGW